MTDKERNGRTDTRRRPVGRREILADHEGHAFGNGVAAVRGVECSCGARFDSWEGFGRHVDGLLAEPPHTPMQAVRNVLADHLGDPYTQDDWDERLEPCIGVHGRFRCGCGWESPTPDIDEWRTHLAGAILLELARVRPDGEDDAGNDDTAEKP